VQSYRHAAKRKNIPPAGLASQGKLREAPKMQYAYNPHLPPILRFDASGASDKLPDLLQTARTRALSADEANQFAHQHLQRGVALHYLESILAEWDKGSV
jgi:adenine-specific DNA-methyltransferase